VTISVAHHRRHSVSARLLLGSVLLAWGCGQEAAPLYKDAAAPIDARARDLVQRMTPEEKFWQLFMVAGDLEQGAERYPHGVFGLQARPIVAEGDTGDAARRLAARVNAAQRYFTTQTRLGIPIIPFEEALHGLVQPGATSFPQAIALAATWDTALVGAVASAIGRETRSRGIRQVLSPVLNIASDVRWGRTEETYGEDPYLTSTMGVAFVRPFEAAGVMTTPKHFVANVGEGGRDSYPIDWNARHLEEVHFPPFRAAIETGGARAVMAAYNSVDGSPASASRWLLTRTLKGGWAFPGVVIADAGGTGGANVLHGTSPDYATSGQRALEAGLDVLFQTSADHAALFLPAFQKGRIAPRVIDSAVTRVLRLKLELGLFEHPFVDAEEAAHDNGSAAHRALALDAARASMVLLKNERDVLPLGRSVRSIAVIGTDAAEGRLGGYSRPGAARVSILDGLRARLGGSTRIGYEPGPGRTEPHHIVVPSASLAHDSAGAIRPGLRAEYFANPALQGAAAVTRVDPAIDFTWTLGAPDSSLAADWYSARWTGKLVAPATGPLQLGVEGPDGYRLYLDGRLILDNWRKQTARVRLAPVVVERGRAYDLRLEYFESTGGARIRLVWDHGTPRDQGAAIGRAAALARASDVAIVVAGIEEGEFQDRASLRLPGRQEELIQAVAAVGKPVVVVLVGGSAVTMGDWIDRVPGVLLVWYPGDEGGLAVADVLLGDFNPAGRLPISFPHVEGQLPLVYNHKPTGRGDDYLGLTGRPLFPFGYGLSYTRFEYDALVIDPPLSSTADSVVIRCRVRNAGTRDGDEVVQLYIRDEVASVARPVLSLAGFQRQRIPAGEARDIRFVVPPAQLSLLDEALRRRVEPGRFRIMVGASSADIRLRGILTVGDSAR
jgi:beta-glucosidase